MKKYIYSLFAVAVILCPVRAKANFPTLDVFTFPESVGTASKLVGQFNKIKESTKTISDISNSVGSNLKTISQLATDVQKGVADAKAFAEKEQARLNELESDIKSRKEKLVAKQNYINDAVSKTKNYQSSVSSIIGSSLNSASVTNEHNEYNVDYDYDYDDEDETDAVDIETENNVGNGAASTGTATTPSRQGFGKTSFYKKSETLALAQNTDKVYDGMKDGRFVFSKELAIYCKITVDDALDPAVTNKCIGELLAHMSDPNASNAATGQKVYQEIVRDTTIRTLSEAMAETLSAAQFESKVLKPLSESLEGAGNTRDDLASLSMTNKESVYVMNRSSYVTGLKLSLDAIRQLGYYNLSDYENSQKSTSE